MEEKEITAIKEIFNILESFGNIILKPFGPPWKKDKADMDKKVRGSWQYGLWKNAVLRRDNYACILCGDDRRSKLQVDHIKPFSLFPELRFAIDNGRTLCEGCHKKTLTYGGGMSKWKKK